MIHFTTIFTAFLLLASAALADSTASYKSDMRKMHHDMKMHYSGQVDSDFVRGMIPHHQGAIDMVKTLRTYGKDPDVLWLGDAIHLSQIEEIGIMSNWLDRRGTSEPNQDVDSETTAAFKQDMDKMHRDMNIAYTGNADLDFVCGMIPHHQGAIDMAAVEIHEGGKPDMLVLAQNIILAQQSDIAYMKRWLKRNNYTCSTHHQHSHH